MVRKRFGGASMRSRIPILELGLVAGALFCGSATASGARAAQSGPKSSSPLNAKGVDLYKAGKIDEAIAAFKDAVAVNPKDGEALTNLGMALDARGRDD